MSEILLQKMPEEFGVHFRREGVLHQVLQERKNMQNINTCFYYYLVEIVSMQLLFIILILFQVQKLTDPDNPICVNQYNESPLSSTGWSSATTPAAAGSALASRETTGRSWTVAGSSLANMFPDQVYSSFVSFC